MDYSDVASPELHRPANLPICQRSQAPTQSLEATSCDRLRLSSKGGNSPGTVLILWAARCWCGCRWHRGASGEARPRRTLFVATSLDEACLPEWLQECMVNPGLVEAPRFASRVRFMAGPARQRSDGFAPGIRCDRSIHPKLLRCVGPEQLTQIGLRPPGDVTDARNAPRTRAVDSSSICRPTEAASCHERHLRERLRGVVYQIIIARQIIGRGRARAPAEGGTCRPARRPA